MVRRGLNIMLAAADSHKNLLLCLYSFLGRRGWGRGSSLGPDTSASPIVCGGLALPLDPPLLIAVHYMYTVRLYNSLDVRLYLFLQNIICYYPIILYCHCYSICLVL